MAKPLVIALPPNLDLEPGCTVRVTAVGATTGAGVAGVTVANISIEANTDDAQALEVGPWQLVTGPGG